MSGLRDLTPLLKPRSVAIIGATPDARRPGGRPLDYLRRFGFAGPIYPVNPRYPEIAGVRCYASVADIAEAPDMAVVSVPAAATLDAVRDCQRAGVPAMTIYTSGFGETGAEGKALEAELIALAEAKGTLICGPNCQGVANFHDRMVANFTSALANEGIDAGGIGFVSQSGLFAGIVTAEFRRRGLGLGYLVSSGNEAVVDFADVLAFMARDERIRVVAGYLEGVRDGRKLEQAAAVARELAKPVVLIKVGRSQDSAAAAASHTGALAGAYAVYAAALAQWGILEADSIQELFDLIETFAVGARPARGDRVGVITNSGGIGVYCADKVRECGLTMASFASGTVEALKARLPAFGSARNPVDFTLQAYTDPESVGAHLRNVVLDDGVDVALACFGIQLLNVDAVVDQVAAANALNDKPVLVGWMLGDASGPPRLRAAGIPCFDDPLAAIKAAKALVRQGRIAATAAETRTPHAMDAAAALVAGHAPGALSESEARAVLAAAGIAPVPGARAADAEAAVAVAREIGYPVVLKVDSPDIAHKTEAGGVALDVRDDDGVRAAFAAITESARARAPEARIHGVGVYRMVRGGVEMICGLSRDPAFGAVVLVGSGGILVEVIEDTALGVAPLEEADAERMIASLKGAALLAGVRGRPPADSPALTEVLLRLSDLARACPAIAELDINPLLVLPEGKGALAADALITLGGEAGRKADSK